MWPAEVSSVEASISTGTNAKMNDAVLQNSVCLSTVAIPKQKSGKMNCAEMSTEFGWRLTEGQRK